MSAEFVGRFVPVAEHKTENAEVYELLNGGRLSWSRVGVFTNIDTAKHVAALVLDTYHEFDGDEGTEQCDYAAEWEMSRDTIGPRNREVGEPKPFLRYGEDGSAFKIDTIVLNTARTMTGVAYPPSCSCADGPYYGAQRADEPVRCLRCNLPAPDLSVPPGESS